MEAKIQARIDPDLKAQGELILKELGMSTTELVRMTFRQLVMRKGLPFDVKIPNTETPNTETIEAMEELRNPQTRKTLKKFSSVQELMTDLKS